MSTASRPRAAFGVKRKNVPRVLVRAQGMHDCITVSAFMFPSPTVDMVTFLSLITALAVAQQGTTGTRAKGSAALRNTKRDALWTAMESLRAYIQGLADVLSAEAAASLIEAAGLAVAETPVHQKALLTATLTATSGIVHLDANVSLLAGKAAASKKVMLSWQMSADGGRTWTDLRSTTYASTDVTGLTLLTTYSFRVSATIGKTAGPWSQAVSLLVH